MSAEQQPNNPLHGKTLEAILNELVDRYGWETLGSLINIRCFNENPSIKSSLKFLRTTPWARQKVEDLYVRTVTTPKFFRRES
ncbi:VF530 family DNA-binding protein [Cesiribacter sp. SM1]|uniref:VF530 family protein n=1 Tax=Cesiribacter sp. SM1 TaxID=2861196 RepID=UPI001CD232BB|nr:VF530 family protein [Cesiribacter sp. SM1]